MFSRKGRSFCLFWAIFAISGLFLHFWVVIHFWVVLGEPRGIGLIVGSVTEGVPKVQKWVSDSYLVNIGQLDQ